MASLARRYLVKATWTALPATGILALGGLAILFFRTPESSIAWTDVLSFVSIAALSCSIAQSCLVADPRNQYFKSYTGWAFALATPYFFLSGILSSMLGMPVWLLVHFVAFIVLGLTLWTQEVFRRRRYKRLGLKAGPEIQKGAA
ncbi:hypothetical protein FKB34_11590 [Glycocaulis profundi]|nr:hypothetical protein FKB34_11590 [Glycocaulis profundi]